MKKRILLVFPLLLSLSVSCRQGEGLSGAGDHPSLLLKASVGVHAPGSRVITDASGTSDFAEGDAIGFFMPGEEEQVKWTFAREQWTPELPLSWPDKVNKFSYCAYYPYDVRADGRAGIPMPDLSLQQGTLSGIGAFDFLTARREVSYPETENGTVSFTGESAFMHAYSLLSITVKKDLQEEDVSLSQVSFKGNNLFGGSTYHFAGSGLEDGISYADHPVVHALTFHFEEPVKVSEETGYTVFLLCNPQDSQESSLFSIAYERDGVAYTASTGRLGKKFEAGKYYRFVLRLAKEELRLEESSITDWVAEDFPEIGMEEIPS